MSHLAGAHLRRTSLVAAVALLGALLAPVAASAGVATTPTITAPLDGASVVSSPLLVSADSTAAFVRFVVGGQGERTIAVSGGEAVTELPVHGLSGDVPLEAYDCDTPTSCAVTPSSISVNVDLIDPEITAPGQNDVVGNSVTVKVKTPIGGALRFFVDGSPVGKVEGFTSTLTKDISLRDRKDGEHDLSVQQCNSDGTVCDGDTDEVTVIKDTKGPRFTDVDSSLGTVFPIKDNYKDTVKLSARVGEKSLETKVEIRKAGGPLVRTLNLGREDAGRLSVTWNGRKSNGDIVPKGKYTFQFIGTDVHGVVGKSGDKVVYVSTKQLVRKSATKTISALASFRVNGSGGCSDLFRLTYDKVRFSWPKGVGYYSNAYCKGRGTDDLALGGHSIGLQRATRYGQATIQAYGAGAFKHAGPGALLSLRTNGDIGASAKLGTSPGWYGVRGLNLGKYVKGDRLRWFVGTVNGNWYDVKEFRISYTYFVLR